MADTHDAHAEDSINSSLEESETTDVGVSTVTPNRRKVVGVTAVGVICVAVAVILGLSPSATSNAGAAAAIRDATTSTLAGRSADLSLSGTVTATGHQVMLKGTGVLDFANSLADMTVSTTAGSTALKEQEVMSGNQLYLSFTSGSQSISSVVPGKNWVLYTLPAVSSPSIGGGVGNPISQIQLLSARGNTVTALGASSIDGIAVTGYSIVTNAALLARREQRYLSSSGLSGESLVVARRTAKAMGTPTIDVWIDSQNLLRRMTITISGTLDGESFSESIQMDLNNFGAAVAVSIPPASQVVSLKDFAAAVSNLGGGNG